MFLAPVLLYYIDMKTLNVTFTRKPQFTPADLSERQLSRIEWAVKASFLQNIAQYQAGKMDLVSGRDAARFCFDENYCYPMVEGIDWATEKARKTELHQRRWNWLDKASARKYFSTCYNYLLSIAKRNGEVIEPERHGKAFYAERYYGYN